MIENENENSAQRPECKCIKMVRIPPPTHKQYVGGELDEIGILTMLGKAAVANDPDDLVMKAQLKSLHDREERLKFEYEALK